MNASPVEVDPMLPPSVGEGRVRANRVKSSPNERLRTRATVIRAKSNTKYQRRYSQPVDRSGGLQCDQTIVLTGASSASDYPRPLRHRGSTGAASIDIALRATVRWQPEPISVAS